MTAAYSKPVKPTTGLHTFDINTAGLMSVQAHGFSNSPPHQTAIDTKYNPGASVTGL